MEIGGKIRKLRILNKFSQPELSSKLGISQTALCEIESGKTKKIDFLLINKIRKEFKVDFDYFLDDNYNAILLYTSAIGSSLNDSTEVLKPEINAVLENIIKRLESLEQNSKI